ncbi:protein-arginine deiminase family protein [Novosphingobium taihuense]|uniref:Protein-arginine deiminase n=1 Tax=Novosphingobium taihuense TaxID=260085 RepID=A0A7W7ABV3_9SPHN|nr:protein-arginine deiminase family protein [Novosphingobium taihuense]MBB4614170.1 protein-arginine deiminase [Novosphingobium taihuense]
MALAPLSQGHAQASGRIEILADTNRDGTVDAADRDGKYEWSSNRGAIFLPNIGDSAKRCPRSADKAISDAALEACNDAQGDVAWAPENLAPLRTAPIKGLSGKASGQVVPTGPGADRVRVFLKRGTRWVMIGNGLVVSERELAAGLELGVDGRDVARDLRKWDGRITIELRVKDRGVLASDSVVMRVAPVIVHNHTQRAQDIFGPDSGRYAPHKTFMTDMEVALRKGGYDRPIRRIQTNDNWAQDFVEFGYASMPGAGGTQKAIRIAIRSPQPGRAAGRALFDLRGPGMGVVQMGGQGYHQVDSFGNLETAPPYRLAGKDYPVGRVVYGDAGDGVAPHEDWINFFAAQQLQSPIVLDTSWLAIGHVDEFVQFIPANNVRGWTIAVKDVDAALALLRKAKAEGHGKVAAFSRPDVRPRSIDDLLGNADWLRQNEQASRKIALNMALLMAETGISEEEVVRVPGLFTESDFHDFVSTVTKKASAPPAGSYPDGILLPPEDITYGPGVLIADYPAPVNGLLVDRTHYIAPRQWGPVIDGVDILEAAVAKAYAAQGIETAFVDDWMTHHIIGGEIHCGTNATREIGAPWWR